MRGGSSHTDAEQVGQLETLRVLWEPSEGAGSAEHRRQPGNKGVRKDVPAEYPLHIGKGIPDLCKGGVKRHPD